MKKLIAFTFLFFSLSAFAQSGQVILQNSVIAFDQTTCPTGWTQVTESQGRILIGEGSGNLDSLGAPLTARTLGATGGLEYTSGTPASTSAPTSSAPSATTVLAVGNDPGGPTDVSLYNNAGTNAEVGEVPLDSNMPPYSTVIFCKRL
ncbi:MAG: hypothetical protein KC493_03670 [Bacteriovoracaceae bacterium]|nr:hypothetical protein [Bacteriovoracaceae bacterium]